MKPAKAFWLAGLPDSLEEGRLSANYSAWAGKHVLDRGGTLYFLSKLWEELWLLGALVERIYNPIIHDS